MKKHPLSLPASAILGLLLCLIPLALSAQKKEVLAVPANYEKPVFDDDINASTSVVNKKGRDPWIVVSDRPNNPTFDGPDASFNQKNKLDFGSFFYVLEEKGNWLHLVKAPETENLKIPKSSPMEDMGWVERNKVLMWMTALKDPNTGIHKKAFSLNKFADIQNIIREGKKDIMKIYDSPYGTNVIAEKTIYEFYFILKKENDRFLIAKDYRLNTRSVQQQLVGWVFEQKVADWNTRVAMEPNFTEQSFNERLANPDLRLCAYSTLPEADAHANSGKPSGNAFWKGDPVILDKSILAPPEYRRYKGGVVRFPLFRCNANNYRTGLIGDIKLRSTGGMLDSMSELMYGEIQARHTRLLKSRQYFDVLFLLEATPSMREYQQALLEYIPKMSGQLPPDCRLRVGVAIYRDIITGKNNVFACSPFSESLQDALDFLAKVSFDLMGDYDDYTDMYTGLYEATLAAGFVPEHTNIVIALGNYADMEADVKRKKDVANRKLTAEKVAEKLATLNVHLFALQPKNIAGNASDRYSRQLRSILLESAIKQQAMMMEITELTGINIQNPIIKGEDNDDVFSLEGGTIAGQIVRAERNAPMSIAKCTASLQDFFDQAIKFQVTLEEKLTQIIDGGSSLEAVSAGPFEAAIAVQLKKLQAESKLSVSDIRKLTKDKYRLYAEAFIPKKIANAAYPTVSYVLFMPDEDLREYIQVLDRLADASDKSIDEQREALYNVLNSMIEQFVGSRLRKSEANELEYSDLINNYVQGLEKGCVDIYKSLGIGNTDFKIKDVKSSKAMPDTQIRAFVKRVLENTKKMKEIYQRGQSGEYVFKSGNEIYYWVPIEYTF